MVLFELQQQFDHIPRRRAAIDIITHEHHGIIGSGVDIFKQCAQLIRTTMDVADREDTRFLARGHLQDSTTVLPSNAPNADASSSSIRAAEYGLSRPAHTDSKSPRTRSSPIAFFARSSN